MESQLRVIIERVFKTTQRGIVEQRLICYRDDSDECTGEGCGQKVMPAMPAKDFFAQERLRAAEIYFPQAPCTSRFLESHVPPLSEEEITGLEQSMSAVKRKID